MKNIKQSVEGWDTRSALLAIIISGLVMTLIAAAPRWYEHLDLTLLFVVMAATLLTGILHLGKKAGLNGIWPLEVQANMDVVFLRREYGKRLVMMGGIDKRVLAKGTGQIEAEVDRVWPVVGTGGYIPHTDHSIPSDVPWGNFRHYRTYLAEKAGLHPGKQPTPTP